MMFSRNIIPVHSELKKQYLFVVNIKKSSQNNILFQH